MEYIAPPYVSQWRVIFGAVPIQNLDPGNYKLLLTYCAV